VTWPDKAARLDALARSVAAFEAARVALEDAVGGALAHGASWSEIGGVLGISRQAAFHRYGPKGPRRTELESEQ
jgi:hypothetical protein